MFRVAKFIKSVPTLGQFNRRTFSQIPKSSEFSNQKRIEELSNKMTEMNAQIASLQQGLSFLAPLAIAGCGVAIMGNFR